MADMADAGREGVGCDGGGERKGIREGVIELTMIFLFAISLAACRVDKARMSESAAVVVSATRGDVQGT